MRGASPRPRNRRGHLPAATIAPYSCSIAPLSKHSRWRGRRNGGRVRKGRAGGACEGAPPASGLIVAAHIVGAAAHFAGGLAHSASALFHALGRFEQLLVGHSIAALALAGDDPLALVAAAEAVRLLFHLRRSALHALGTAGHVAPAVADGVTDLHPDRPLALHVGVDAF